jgi:DNA-binding MarR family transcriptional regulator
MPPSQREMDSPGSLADLLVHAARGLRRRWSRLLVPWDLSPHQSRALRVVCQEESPRLNRIAESLRIAPRSATEVVDGLESRGLVARVPDPADRRATCVEPTPEGLRVAREIDEARRLDSEDYFAPLSERERAQLARLLAKLEH